MSAYEYKCKKACHLKYGTSCFDSRGLPGIGGAIVGDVHGGVGSLGSALNAGTGGRLKLELGWKNQNMAFRSEITQILKKFNKAQYWIELI